jgi:hypothetical protein
VQTNVIPAAKSTDLKPFRPGSIKLRGDRHGRPAVKKAHPQNRGKGRGRSDLPLGARGQHTKPAKTNRGHHTGQVQHQKPKPTPPRKPPAKLKKVPPLPPPNKGQGKGPTGGSGVQDKGGGNPHQ